MWCIGLRKLWGEVKFFLFACVGRVHWLKTFLVKVKSRLKLLFAQRHMLKAVTACVLAGHYKGIKWKEWFEKKCRANLETAMTRELQNLRRWERCQDSEKELKRERGERQRFQGRRMSMPSLLITRVGIAAARAVRAAPRCRYEEQDRSAQRPGWIPPRGRERDPVGAARRSPPATAGADPAAVELAPPRRERREARETPAGRGP